MKKFISIILSVVTLLSLCAGMGISVSAANYSTSYSSYNEPENSGDYAYWSGSKVVKSGSTTKNEIKWMQAALNNCISYEGLSASYIDVDGSFGPASKATTIKFQKAAGLTADGSFGPATIKAMKKILNDGKKNSLKPKSSTKAKYSLCWPVSKNTTNYKRITSSLGNRTAPVKGASVKHKGIDIGIASGSKVLATYDGTVKFVDSNSARGKYVVVYHDKIGLTSVYQHLSSYSVKAGQKVSKGQQIAKSGNTGNSSGPHLHFELVVTNTAPKNVDCAWTSGAQLIDGHYDNKLINYEYRS